MSKFSGLLLPADTAQRLTLIHPVTRTVLKDKAGNEAWLDVLSSDSKKYRTVLATFRERDRKSRLNRDLSDDEVMARSAEAYAAITVGWHLCTLDGDPIDVPCTPENARELYEIMAETAPWLREQIEAFIFNRGNFYGANSTS